MENIKVALVHDWLTGQRGGERVLEVFCDLFPDAPIYTLFHFPGSQVKLIEEKRIITSFLQAFPWLEKKYRFYLPLYALAVELFDLQKFDLIVSSSHCVAKGIIPNPQALHISYIHSPVRYAWNQYSAYFAPDKLGVFSRFLIPPVIQKLRVWDAVSSDRVDFFIANSHNVARRIQKYYRRQSEVIHPPVDTGLFTPGKGAGAYYLIVSALVPYKRIDLAVETFNRIGMPLKIVGEGPEYKKLRRMASKNIEFLGRLRSDDLVAVYQEAKALIMPGEEDFGINSLESQACGVPVIAFGKGGALETVIPDKTGLFFPELSPPSLKGALDKFEGMPFNKSEIRSNALNFSKEKFGERITAYIQEKWIEFKNKQ
ncbi:MAG: glycosyltransferase [Candidatus Aminicenantes bacterium]|nr:glycosyltransferase [Candidatus Aminicenantes bacterium]